MVARHVSGRTSRFWRHLRALWPGWGILLPIPFVVHAAWVIARGQFHWENGAVLVASIALFATGPRTKKLFLGAYPIGLIGILYDTMRLVEHVGVSTSRVHVCDLRAHELALFGVTLNGQPATLHDWFQAHPSPVLDAICAFPYATFLFVVVGCAVWLYFRDYPKMLRYAWCYFALNIAGFLTYHLYPAAPPWYFHAHGCQVDLFAHASEGPALARVDARLGIHYFAGMYGRASDVFGAMPSLHVAYALLVALEGWSTWTNGWRAASVVFFLTMCFAAVYLDHHWVLDAIAGMAYSAVVVMTARWLTRPRTSPGVERAVAIDQPDATRGSP
jgi:membrane-associated phospholipid phosphatase